MKPKNLPQIKVSGVGGQLLTPAATPQEDLSVTEENRRHSMYERKPRRSWSVGEMSQQDSGSESAPLLSSESHASFGRVIFHDSETSDLDSTPLGGSPNYGSVRTSSLISVVAVPSNPKRLLRLPSLPNSQSPLVTSTNASLRPCYSPQGYYLKGLLLVDEGYEGSNSRAGVKEVSRAFLPGALPLPLTQGSTPTSYKGSQPKQNSLVTIFSIWNTILGSSLLTMPWGVAMTGLIPGVFLMVAMGGLCLYTAYRLLQVHKYHGGDEKVEVPELCRMLLGPWAEYIAKTFSVTVLLGANVVYWVLMSNFLYHSVNFFYDNIVGLPLHPPFINGSHPPEVLCPNDHIYNDSSAEHTFANMGPIWDLHRTVPIFLALPIFPLLNFNSATFFTKFNALGTASVIYLIVFVLIKSASWGVHMDNAAWESSWKIRPTFPALSGMLALSFFIHNIIINIMQNNRNPRNNGRDLTIAYLLVIMTYILVATAFFICFPLAKSCIEDNLLNNFQTWDGLTVGARVVLLFQLLTVYPLIAYMLRIQLLYTIFKTSDCARSYVLIVNFITISICVLFAVFMPRVGTIIRYTGAMSGLIYIFTLPILLHLASMYRQGRTTTLSVILHLTIPVVGGSNLIAQFFVEDH